MSSQFMLGSEILRAIQIGKDSINIISWIKTVWMKTRASGTVLSNLNGSEVESV